MKILIFILIILIACALIIVNNNNLYFSQKEDVKTFGKLYLGWAEQIFQNAKTLTGHAISMNWFPKDGISNELNESNKAISKI